MFTDATSYTSKHLLTDDMLLPYNLAAASLFCQAISFSAIMFRSALMGFTWPSRWCPLAYCVYKTSIIPGSSSPLLHVLSTVSNWSSSFSTHPYFKCFQPSNILFSCIEGNVCLDKSSFISALNYPFIISFLIFLIDGLSPITIL